MSENKNTVNLKMDNFEDITSLQFFLSNSAEELGILTNLKTRDGNEDKLKAFSKAFKDYLSSKNYIKNDSVDKKYEKEIKNIVLYLILNTEIEMKKDNVFLLTKNICPISKCLLIHVLVEICLTESISKILSFLSPEIVIELTEEFIKYCNDNRSKKYLKPSFDFLKCIILCYFALERDEENKIIMKKLMKIGGELSKKIKKYSINNISDEAHKQTGHILLQFLRILLLCDENDPEMHKMIDAVISEVTALLLGVTLEIFCVWAESNFEGFPLQAVIGFESYRFINKYNSYEPAKHLTKMLSNYSRKPFSLRKIIRSADTETIIDAIHNNNSDREIQKKWFEALIQTDVFSDENKTDCFEQYLNLCDSEGDVYRVLEYSKNHLVEPKVKQIVLNCLKNLQVDSLSNVLTRYFYEFGFNSDFCVVENLDETLTNLLKSLASKTDESERDSFVKEILILFFQNPEQVLRCFYKECLVNFCKDIDKFDGIFKGVKYISEINSLRTKLLWDIFDDVTGENLENYSLFFKKMIKIEYVSMEKMSEELFEPKVKILNLNENYDKLKIVLDFLSGLEYTEISPKFLVTFLNCLNKCRCKFLEFVQNKQKCAHYIVEILKKVERQDEEYIDYVKNNDVFKLEDLEKINKFYFDSLVCKKIFLIYMYPNITSLTYTECLRRLVQLLPRCVHSEWKEIFATLNSIYNTEKTNELFTDVLILLCQLIGSQNNKKSAEFEKGINGLKYCFNLYKEIIIVGEYEKDTSACENLCRIIKYLPEELKDTESLKIIEISKDTK